MYLHAFTKDVPLYYIGNYRIGEVYSCLQLVLVQMVTTFKRKSTI